MSGIEATMAIWNSAPGRSGIFNFPFRIYSKETLLPIEGSSTTHRYRITFIEKNPSSERRMVPSDVWPNFQTHPSYSGTIDINAAIIDLSYGDTECYSQLRLDVWGEEPDEEVAKFCTRFLDLIRLYTNQYWINTYEANFNLYYITSLFPIDESGRCMEYPNSGQRVMGSGNFVRLDNDLLMKIFVKALDGEEIASYWILYFDALNTFIKEQMDQAVMLLVLSLEVARNIEFQRFIPVKKETLSGAIFESPFDDTDLIKNLSFNLKKAIGRSLEDEHPEEWDCIKKLYVARHQVAHGKRAAYREEGQMKLVENPDFLKWAWAARNALAWLMNLNVVKS